jgi:NAD-dependent dihydropyrimidine dehydrogenase PreA subunit
VRVDKCTGCLDCVEVCPQNAIQVSFSGGSAR